MMRFVMMLVLAIGAFSFSACGDGNAVNDDGLPKGNAGLATGCSYENNHCASCKAGSDYNTCMQDS